MKILYSCLSRSWGGMEMFTISAVKQLLKRDIKVELLCAEESRIHIEANNLGIMIHPIKAVGYFHPASIARLSSILKKSDYDLIHTQASKDLWLIVPALKISGKNMPLFLTKQIGSFVEKKDLLHKALYERVTCTFAISRSIQNNLIKTTPLSESKIRLLHNGIDTEKFNPKNVDKKSIRNEYEISDQEIVIGMLARFSPGKGHEEFLWAAKELNNKFSNLRYMIVGEASRGEDEYAKHIRGISAEYELNNMIFTGFRSDTPEVLASLDIFVFPSHSEAFGIALAEAMAMGKPSVCSNTDGILDIAVDGETSFLFEAKNRKDLLDKIIPLIESEDLRNSFGSAARKRIVENFDIEQLTDKAIDFYKMYL